MATTRASNDRTAWKYTDDLGNVWSVSAKSVMVTDVTDGPKLGGSAAVAGDLPIPGNFVMRKAEFNAADGTTIYVPCYDTSAAAWDTPGTTLTLNVRGVDTEFTKGTRTRGEKRNRKGVKPGN